MAGIIPADFNNKARPRWIHGKNKKGINSMGNNTMKICPIMNNDTECINCKMYESSTCLIKKALNMSKQFGNLTQLVKIEKQLESMNEKLEAIAGESEYIADMIAGL